MSSPRFRCPTGTDRPLPSEFLGRGVSDFQRKRGQRVRSVADLIFASCVKHFCQLCPVRINGERKYLSAQYVHECGFGANFFFNLIRLGGEKPYGKEG